MLCEIDIPNWITAVVTLAAFIAVIIEYIHQKRLRCLDLAQQNIEHIENDEMLQFAVTTLDWGAGLVIFPLSWRDVIGKPATDYQYDVIFDALRPALLESTSRDPIQLLYRHAFVKLFNHFEKINTLLDNGSLKVEDLKPLTYIAKELICWKYAPENDKMKIFVDAMHSWYPDKAPWIAINNIALAHE